MPEHVFERAGLTKPRNAKARAGRKGGLTRAARMTAEQRREAARRAVQARWAKPGARDKPAVPIEACRRGGSKGGVARGKKLWQQALRRMKEQGLTEPDYFERLIENPAKVLGETARGRRPD